LVVIPISASNTFGVVWLYLKEKRIKKETIQDSTSQKLSELEKLVFLLVLASVPWW